jgi:hypothetical protein
LRRGGVAGGRGVPCPPLVAVLSEADGVGVRRRRCHQLGGAS